MKRNRGDRRGMMLVATAVLTVLILTCLAVVADMSRMYAQKNALQTAADAAALSGVIELIGDTTTVIDSAVSMGQRNTVLGNTISVRRADVVCGQWNDSASVYLGDSGHCGGVDNAVTVTTRDSASYIFASLLGTQKEIAVTARAYAAYVGKTDCVKPWAIPYERLTKTLQPSNTDILRPLSDYDLELLKTLSQAARTFELKIGTPPDAGNFGSLRIPTDDPNFNGGGKSLYRYNIINCNSAYIGVGSVLETEPGVALGPTIQGIKDFCDPYNSATHACHDGTKLGDDGDTVGKIAKAALWSQRTDKGTGIFDILVEQIVSFSLDSITSDARVFGHFVPILNNGAVTNKKTTVQRPILVK